MLFNIYINDTFFALNEIDTCTFAEDLTLYVIIDNNLRFDKHVSNIFLKANRKLSASTSVAKFLFFNKKTYSF